MMVPLHHHAPPFSLMDFYNHRILKPDGDAIPFVKIVFALAARTPYLNVVHYGPMEDYGAIMYEI